MSDSPATGSPSPTVAASPEELTLFIEQLRFLVQRECPRFAASTPTQEVLDHMRENGTGGILVTSDGDATRLDGIFTERDYLDKLHDAPAARSQPISEFMTSNPKVLTPDDSVGDAVRMMTEGGYRHMPICDENGETLGLVSCRNLVVFISEHFPQAVFNHPPELNQHPATPEGG